ncbi:981b4416-b5b9-46f0-b758-9370ad5b2ec8 [Sclerotinia trifoliorum]|uniref:981b4416-b5b9-46f0-b758-9370ad5b2ec8 n=1 Tax=Sclerotinia trifoliorum TaxID=28548 RepID=A0A8H2VPG6_9HELO|nr:981b4416-b5b9-46f0-b758-9370ad5b2ec8 [Sclerotinia trifoliorum]
MSPLLSPSVLAFIKFIGFDREKLPTIYKKHLDKTITPGGKAEQVVGKVQQVNIKSRCGNPVHKSHYNPADKEDIISVKILGSKGSKTFHIYPDGMATSNKDERKTEKQR